MFVHLRKSRKFSYAFLTIILVVQTLGRAAAQPKKDDISIGYASPSVVFAPVFVAQEQGLFKKYGLGVKGLILLRGTGPAAAQMLMAGTAPIAALGGALVGAAVRGGGTGLTRW